LAQKLLSAVVRLQERFGTGYVIDFLRGSNAAKIQEEHKQLKTFGIGADVSKESWHEIVRDLLAQDYLAKSDGLYPILKLTTKSSAVLKGLEKVMITKSKEVTEVVSEQKVDYEEQLLQQLKDLRRQIANEENVPAYIVLSDASLMELATYLPHNKDEFSKISGFGEVKIEKYGKRLWDVVAAYCREHSLKSRIHLKTPKRVRKQRPERETDTKQQSFDLFAQGHSIAQIADRRNLSLSTIENHLAFYVQSGTLAIEQVIDNSKVQAIQKAIELTGSVALTPAKEILGEGYSFGEIRLVMAYREWMKSRG
jgi:ATP-dependent DNA helicase RecQ